VKRICVFCGSSPGNDPLYLAAAKDFGRALAQSDIGLVYGGASVGLMGAVADSAMEHGGEVIGVIPEALVRREVAHGGLRDLRVVASMHERKALMAELSDGFVALPGGIGTLEEMFEIWTWAQLGHHAKPCSLLNVGGFYDALLAFLDQTAAAGFLKPMHRGMLIVGDDPETLLAKLRVYAPPATSKWIGWGET
jgi:uncharacterized protein (TIGR00730 family)